MMKESDEGSLWWRFPDVFNDNLLSRLDAEDVRTLRCVCKTWYYFFTSRCFDKLQRRRSPLLVIADAVRERWSQRFQVRPDLCIEDEDSINTSVSAPVGGDVKDFRARKVVFNYGRAYQEDVRRYVSSCGDLMCFYSPHKVCVYSPTTDQYLRYHCDTRLESHEFNVGLVYIGSIDVYKIVMLEILPVDGDGDCDFRPCSRLRPPTRKYVRFKAITVEEGEEEYGGGVNHTCNVDDDKHGTSSSWELIGDHDLHSSFVSVRGNLIGVDGVVYTIATIGFGREAKKRLVSLDFKEDTKQHRRFKIFSLPKVACPLIVTNTLSQVKDVLCFPEVTNSGIVLWLLKDRNTSSWVKGFTISYISRGVCGEVAYFPPGTAADGNDDGCGAGLFLFNMRGLLYQYDIRTKEVGHILPKDYVLQKPTLLVFTGCRFSLKNGLRCYISPEPFRTPPPSQGSPLPPPPPGFPPPPPPPPQHLHSPPLQGSLPPAPDSHPPLPQGFLPPPHYHHPPPPQGSLPPLYSHSPPPQGSLPPPPHGSLPPPPPPPPPPYYYPLLPQGSLLSPYTQSPLAQGSLPPPLYSHPPTPQFSIPPPPYYHHNLQHTAYSIMPHPLPPKGLPPSFNPQDFQCNISSPQVKRRKLLS